MEFSLVFLGYLALLLVSYLLSYFVGEYLIVSSKYPEEKPFQKLFFSTFIGQLAITALFAIIYTNGRTVFSTYLFIYLFYLVYSKKYQHFSKTYNLVPKITIPWAKIALVSVIFIFTFSWSFYIAMNPNVHGFVNVPDFAIGEYHDYFQYYTNVGFFIQESGIENTYKVNNIIDPAFHVSTPYHYYDLWINDAFATIFRSNYLKSQYLISRPLMLGTSIMGILAIAEYYSKVTFKHIIYAICFAFVGPLCVHLLKEHFAFLEYINPFFDFMLQINPHKNAYYYSFIITGILLIKQEKWLYSTMIFSALAVASITAFPSMTAVCFALPIVLLVLKKIKIKQAALIYLQIIFTYLLLAISLSRGDSQNFETYSVINLLKESLEGQSLSNFITVTIKADIHKTTYYFLLYFIPVAIIAFTKWRTLKTQIISNIHIAAILLVLFVAGMVTWNLTYFIHDSYQFFIHPVSVSFNTIFFFILLDFLNNLKYRIVSHLVLIFCVSCNLFLAIKRIGADQKHMNPYSNEYLQSIEEITNQNKDLKIIASLRKSISFNERYFQGALLYYYGHQLTQFQDNFGYVSIDDLSMKLEYKNAYKNKTILNQLKVSAFYHFVEQERKKGNNLSEEEYQILFLKKYHINYLIFNKEVEVPEGIKKIIQTSIEDKKSGEVFCVLSTK